MPLGTEIGLGPGHIVLDGDPAPLTERDTAATSFRPTSIVAKRSPISATAGLLFGLGSIFCAKDQRQKRVELDSELRELRIFSLQCCSGIHRVK